MPSAPQIRIKPEAEKNQRDLPMKSKLQCTRSLPAPSALG